ncbi:PfkB family carbohydrate kinase [Herbaspirillum huttiense]|uniref:PfkB family carbohydrate kinase n=1 Tax=Herbaspirillum huttiense TaxID=863372 RepID=UPI0031DE496D
MIHIAGGTYWEECKFPTWNALFGSAGRAAVALEEMSDDIRLSTFGSQTTRQNREVLGKFSIHNYVEAPDVRFRYFHCLSRPDIHPPQHLLKRTPSFVVTDENILRFGAIEGDIKVQGERVVYDPQSAFDPEPFGVNGSTADSLAIVCNSYEASLWTQEQNCDEAAKIILGSQNAEVVVIKKGFEGAFVYTANNPPQKINSYMTPRVFSIGSGDVFSAVFAHFWAEKRQDPVHAAKQASLATAFYCSTQSLPISPGQLDDASTHPPIFTLGSSSNRPQYDIYLAGPFFTMPQRWLVEEALKALQEAGLKVFSPYHAVGSGSAAVVGPLDIAALNDSAAVLALIDGLDSGTIYEIGYAAAKDIPIVAFSEQVGTEDLKMIEGNGAMVQSDFTTAIYQAKWKALQ